MAVKKIPLKKAVGTVLAHDITKIIPGEFKGVGFKRGHIVTEEDIPELLKLGKRYLYILTLSPGEIHEDEAAEEISRLLGGQNITYTKPQEGKINLVSTVKGLVKINFSLLYKINKLGDIIVSTVKDGFPCEAGQTVAATRVIPLTIKRKRLEKLALLVGKEKVIDVNPFRTLKIGAVVTGSEIYAGLVPDGFERYVAKKIQSFGCEIVKKIVVPDDRDAICRAILELETLGCELIVTTGGLSVDPDDVTLAGIKKAGGKIITYGSPILPGAMFLYAKLRGKPLLGLPACVYYAPTTAFDLIFPRLLAAQEVTKKFVAERGHGGLCLNCEVCRYPICPFGK